MTESVRALAARQLADYRAGTPGTFFADPEQPPLGLDDAYRVQAEVAALRAPAERVVGYKVGCTGPGTRAQFGLDGPIRGLLYDTELHPSGSELSSSAYAELAIEGELAVRLGDDGRIATVFPVIELHNYVFRGQPPTLAELVANNGIHAGVVLPPPAAETPWRGDEPPTGRLTVGSTGPASRKGRWTASPEARPVRCVGCRRTWPTTACPCARASWSSPARRWD